VRICSAVVLVTSAIGVSCGAGFSHLVARVTFQLVTLLWCSGLFAICRHGTGMANHFGHCTSFAPFGCHVIVGCWQAASVWPALQHCQPQTRLQCAEHVAGLLNEFGACTSALVHIQIILDVSTGMPAGLAHQQPADGTVASVHRRQRTMATLTM
jgi:hypothetical protein